MAGAARPRRRIKLGFEPMDLILVKRSQRGFPQVDEAVLKALHVALTVDFLDALVYLCHRRHGRGFYQLPGPSLYSPRERLSGDSWGYR